MDLAARKRALRRATIRRILALDPADRARQEAVLVDLFPHLPGLSSATTLLLYASAFPEEFATRPMIRHALDSGRVVACPRVDRAARTLRLHRIDDPDRDLAPGTLGIPE